MVEETSSPQPAQQPMQYALRVIETFAAAHGQPVRLIPSHLGRPGVRLVLIGADGAMGDLMIPGSVSLDELAMASPFAEITTWQTDTVAALKISAARRRKMASS